MSKLPLLLDWQTFESETMPVVDYFKKQGYLREIDAEKVVCTSNYLMS
jgi:hypothetical protein